MVQMTEEVSLSKNKRFCECGCGKEVKGLTHHKPYQLVRFVKGHHARLAIGEKNNNWKGGFKINGHGYRMILIRDHPDADLNGYILEHRWTMEQVIGRRLESYEDVHHKNGIKTDNRMENLELMTDAEHTTKHNILDMSNRMCVDCKGTADALGRKRWHRLQRDNPDLVRCDNCYSKYKWKNGLRKS